MPEDVKPVILSGDLDNYAVMIIHDSMIVFMDDEVIVDQHIEGLGKFVWEAKTLCFRLNKMDSVVIIQVYDKDSDSPGLGIAIS